MVGTNYIDRIKNKQTKTPEKRVEDNLSGLYLFCSFDLVNSTAFKTLFPTIWPTYINKFYELITKNINDETDKFHSEFKIWKFVGDEVLLYCKIVYEEDVYRAPVKVLALLRDCLISFDKMGKLPIDTISLKATLWIAYSDSYDLGKEGDEQSDAKRREINLITKLESNNSYNLIDFLGPDIDTGFRIASFAGRSKLVISADLAYLIFLNRIQVRKKNIYKPEKNLKIVSYQALKGVWNGRKYPIIWFDDTWDEHSMYRYDEEYNSEIIHKIKAGILTQHQHKLKWIEKIYQDLGRTEKIQLLNAALKAIIPTKGTTSGSATPKLSEVHCVAVCMTKDGKILIAKRLNSKSTYPNIWEFGCSQALPDTSFKEVIELSYKEDFKAKLLIENDPIPIGSYTFFKKSINSNVPGIIFYAELLNKTTVLKNYNKRKHSVIKLFDPKDLSKIDEKNYVPKFKESVLNAVEIWKRKYPKKNKNDQ